MRARRRGTEEGLAIGQELDDARVIAYSQTGLSRVLLKQGDLEAASAGLRENVTLWREVETLPGNGTVRCLEVMALLAFAEGQYARMARLFGQAERLREVLHFPLYPMDQADYEGVPAARAALGEEAFAAAWEEGRAMTTEQAIAYALEEEETRT